MSTRNDYTADEWKAISAAPAAAGLAIALSDFDGPGRVCGDTTSVGVAMRPSALVDAPEIVRVIAECITSGTGRLELPELANRQRVHSKEVLIGTVRFAVRAIETKSPAELEPFKAWLASVAAKVCHATNPDVAPAQVSHAREHTIAQLARVLGMKTSCRTGSFVRSRSLARG